MIEPEKNFDEIERLITAARPAADIHKLSALSYASGLAAGRKSAGRWSFGNWYALSTHACSALSGAVVALMLLWQSTNSMPAKPHDRLTLDPSSRAQLGNTSSKVESLLTVRRETQPSQRELPRGVFNAAHGLRMLDDSFEYTQAHGNQVDPGMDENVKRPLTVRSIDLNSI